MERDEHGPLDEAIELLGDRRAAAAHEMAALGGSSSACTMGRAGRSFPAYKYHEGQAAGFGAALRVLRRAGDDAGMRLDALAASSRPSWKARAVPAGIGRPTPRACSTPCSPLAKPSSGTPETGGVPTPRTRDEQRVTEG